MKKETELVCGNYTGTSLNKENALAWLKFTDENEFHTNDRSFWDMLLGRNRGQYMQKVKHYTQVDHFIYDKWCDLLLCGRYPVSDQFLFFFLRGSRGVGS